ncbi:MAG TPA: hypothetical protein VMI32_15325 [Candidatus Solibacter sp.]|nr:hypothetical protein [Candidatus Solibacter sp.]
MKRTLSTVGFALATAMGLPHGLTAALPNGVNHPQLISDSFSHSVSSHEVKDIYFLDTAHGWIAVTNHEDDTGHILITGDAGKTWHWSPAPSQIAQLVFLNPQVGFALRVIADSISGQSTVQLFSSIDGGGHWLHTSDLPIHLPNHPGGSGYVSMAFADQSHGWFVGQGDRGCRFILESTDAGKSFQPPPEAPRDLESCLGVYAPDDVGVLILGVNHLILSVDGGHVWQSPVDPEKLGISPQLFDMSSALFENHGRGWIVGQGYRGNGTILRTDDYGRSWRMEFGADVETNFKSIWPTDATHRCVVGYSTLLFCTSDDGFHWTSRDVLPPRRGTESPFFGHLVLLPSGRGWVVRYGGYLNGTLDGGQSWHELDPMNLGTN